MKPPYSGSVPKPPEHSVYRRKSVTVCIGVICDHIERRTPSIILCADTKISSSGLGCKNTACKYEIINDSLAVLRFDDEARATELTETLRHYISGSQALTVDNVEDRIREVARAQKRKLVDEYLGSTWGVLYSDYLGGALNNLPEKERVITAEAIKNVSLNAGLIVGVFVEGEPRLLTIDSDCSVYSHSEFAVRGSGQHIAYASLYQREYSAALPFLQAQYLVYEAKKLSESDAHVGWNEDIMVLTRDKPVRWVDTVEERLDYLYERFGLQEVTADLVPIWEGILGKKNAEIAELQKRLALSEKSASQNDFGPAASQRRREREAKE